MSQNVIAAEKLFLTADKSALVREGDLSAAFLYATAGDEIPAEAAERFGLVDGKLPLTEAEQIAAEEAALKATAEEAALQEAADKAAADKAWALEEQQRALKENTEAAAKADAEAAAKVQAETKPAAAPEIKPAAPVKKKA
jgi:enoyl-CoA hydratase/carnithine racemase